MQIRTISIENQSQFTGVGLLESYEGLEMLSETHLHGTYRHFKTENLYEVIGFAHHSETCEDMVVYRALYDCPEFGENQLWVRPKQMFFEQVMHNGQMVPRFQRIEPA